MFIHVMNNLPLTRQQVQNVPLMLARACVEPASAHSQPLHSLMLPDQLLYFLYTAIVFCSNLYLYRFLQTHTDNNTALRETDQRRNRKRNIVPASFGMIHVAFYLLTYLGNKRQALG